MSNYCPSCTYVTIFLNKAGTSIERYSCAKRSGWVVSVQRKTPACHLYERKGQRRENA